MLKTTLKYELSEHFSKATLYYPNLITFLPNDPDFPQTNHKVGKTLTNLPKTEKCYTSASCDACDI